MVASGCSAKTERYGLKFVLTCLQSKETTVHFLGTNEEVTKFQQQPLDSKPDKLSSLENKPTSGSHPLDPASFRIHITRCWSQMRQITATARKIADVAKTAQQRQRSSSSSGIDSSSGGGSISSSSNAGIFRYVNQSFRSVKGVATKLSS